MYKIAYRKQGPYLIRQDEVACETMKNGLHKPGERTCVPTDTMVTVQVVTPYFPAPKTPAEQAEADRLYESVETAADEYVRTQFPGVLVLAAE
jgi:hypothetical protein